MNEFWSSRFTFKLIVTGEKKWDKNKQRAKGKAINDRHSETEQQKSQINDIKTDPLFSYLIHLFIQA